MRRQPEGIPAGGQFAPDRKAEPLSHLGQAERNAVNRIGFSRATAAKVLGNYEVLGNASFNTSLAHDEEEAAGFIAHDLERVGIETITDPIHRRFIEGYLSAWGH